MIELPERIAIKIEIADDGCWLWHGWREKRQPRKLQYGKVWWEGQMKYAHRVIYTLLHGAIPDGMQLDHLCGVPFCVNPAHLEPVVAQVNVRRGRTGQNMVARITCHCGECKTCKGRQYMRRHRARKRK